MDNLNLEDEDEDEGLSYHVGENVAGQEDLQLSLVGRFVTKRSIRTHIMKERLAEVW